MHIDFSLPFREPVLVFTIIIFVILVIPLIFSKLNLPPIIGLIITGALIGPNGFNILLRNSSVILFGSVGLLYIMFLAGIEIDLNEFKKNKNKSVIFGLYTFFIPITLGTLVFHYFLGYSLISSILIGSMFASHTLVTYPIVSKLGITKNIAVNSTVGGTMITDTAALLVLAVIADTARGELKDSFWIQLFVSTIIFVCIVLFLFPIISRWFFKNFSDNITQYIFVLGIVFLSAFLSMIAGIESIVGAFLAGIALNRLIPSSTPLMNKIEFVGNALFIPFFLISVGMLIDYKIIFRDFQTLIIGLTMASIATLSKWVAAFLTQKTFRLSSDQRLLIFGLSNSQAAATLAAVMVGYNIIIGQTPEGVAIRLLDENVLNGTIIMILITCTIASFATQKAAIQVAKTDLVNKPIENQTQAENILIGISNEETVENLIQLAISSVDKKHPVEIYALHIITAEKENAEIINRANQLLEKAQKYASSIEFKINPLMRYDLNIVSGMMNTIKEKNIKQIYIGMNQKKNWSDSTFGNLTEDLLSKDDITLYIYKPCQPLNTIKKFVLVIPRNAEIEPHFNEWFFRITQLATNIGNKIEIFAESHTIDFLENKQAKNLNLFYTPLDDFEDFLIITKEVSQDTMLVINLARKNSVSYHPAMNKIPHYLNKYFKKINCLLIYPRIDDQIGEENNPYSNFSLQNNIVKIKDKIESIFKS